MTIDLKNNPNQRTPCVLVLDASYSMSSVHSNGRRAIDELNEGIRTFVQTLQDDPTALTRVQVAVVVVGGPRNDASLFLDWTDASELEPFELTAGGNTPLGEGMLIAFSTIDDLKSQLRDSGVSYTRPWIFVISDGEPTSPRSVWNDAVKRCEQALQDKHALINSVAVEGADLRRLEELCGYPPRQLTDLNFKEFFVWLTGSLSIVSRSRPGDRINLPSTDPWANVGV
jgi:uncharacterized protein YegL